MRIRGLMSRGILVLLFILMMAILVSGQTEEVLPEEKVVEAEVSKPQELVEPVEIITRLDVTIVDDVNDKIVKLENCAVQVIGELLIVNDSFTYQKTFLEGDRYEITIHFKPKE